jgi:hypothetical protein
LDPQSVGDHVTPNPRQKQVDVHNRSVRRQLPPGRLHGLRRRFPLDCKPVILGIDGLDEGHIVDVASDGVLELLAEQPEVVGQDGQRKELQNARKLRLGQAARVGVAAVKVLAVDFRIRRKIYD